MRITKAQICGALIAAAMFLLLLPATAFATEVNDADELSEALESGGEITLTADIEVDMKQNWTITKDVVLDLNGRSITSTYNESNYYLFKVEGGSFTLNDSSKGSTGKIEIKGASSSYPLQLNGTGSAFTMNGGTITAAEDALDIYTNAKNTTVNINGGTLSSSTYSTLGIRGSNTVVNITGGLIENTGGSQYGAFVSSGYGSTDPEAIVFNMTGGKLTSNGTGILTDYALTVNIDEDAQIETKGVGVSVKGTTVLNVDGGSITSTNSYALQGSYDSSINVTGGSVKTSSSYQPVVYLSDYSKAEISGGTITGSKVLKVGSGVSEDNFSVTGGTFQTSSGSKVDVGDYLPSGMEQDETGAVVKNEETAKVSVDNVWYATIREAIAALKDGSTMTIVPGEYDVTATRAEGTYGSGFIIDKDNVTIKAEDSEDKPVIYGFTNKYSAGTDDDGINGQDTIYVSGSGVTLENLTIMPLGGYRGGDGNTYVTKTVEVTATATDFKMTGCETTPNTYKKDDVPLENAEKTNSGNIHVSINDADITGNSFGAGTTISAGWRGSSAADTYSVDVSKNYWGEGATAATIANAIDGNVVIRNYYTNAEMTETATIGGIPVANADQLEAAATSAKSGDTIVLAAGTYNLTSTLSITKRVNLVGAGADATTIVGPVSYQMSESQNDALLSVSGITFEADATNAVQGLQFRGEEPNNGYDMDIEVVDCAFEGWTYGITMNSHANGYDMTVSGCDFSEGLYAVSYNYDDTTEGQKAENTLTFGEGNIISENGFAVQKFSNSVATNYDDKTYQTIEAFEDDEPTIEGTVVYVTSDLADAISSAKDGSTLIVAPGTYAGNITFGGKSLTIKAQYPAYKNGVKEADESKLSKFTGTFNTSEGTDDSAFAKDQTVVIDGFALSGNGLKIGNCNYNSVGNLEVRHCTMECGGNLSTADRYNQYNHFVKISGKAGGPYASVVVEDNYVSGTLLTNPYTITPIQLWDVEYAVVRNNVIDVTECAAAQGISVSMMKEDAYVVITDNEIRGVGGGIYVTTWKLGGNADNATAVFDGIVTVEDNKLSCAASEEMYPIFFGYEEAARNENPYGLLAGTQTVTGNTNNGKAVDAEIVRGPESQETKLITATFMDGESVVATVSGEPNGDGKLEVKTPAAPTKSGYTFKGWKNGESIHGAGASVTIDADANFAAVWSANSTPAPVPTPEQHAVTVGDFPNGKVSAEPAKAEEGDKVTLTVAPDAGFELAFIAVVGPDGEEVELSANADGTYSFEMPGFDVEVEASFACDGGALCPTDKFTDVDQDEWYHDAIDWAVTEGVLNGIGGTSLMDPNGKITRAQMAQVLYNVEGAEAGDSALLSGYSDADANAWYAGALSWAVEEGIFSGWQDGGASYIDPEGALTREQAAAVLMRWTEANGGDVSGRADLSDYPDVESVSEWATESMRWAVSAGVLSGVSQPDGTLLLDGQGTATRAQTAQLMMRLLAE